MLMAMFSDKLVVYMQYIMQYTVHYAVCSTLCSIQYNDCSNHLPINYKYS